MPFKVERLGPNYSGSKGYAYRISSKEVSMVVTEQGGRILSLKRQGHEVSWSNPDWFEKIPEILRNGRAAATWDDVTKLGGGKILVAPQDLYGGHVPFLDLNLGLFTSKQIDGGVELTSPVCSENGLQIVEEIKMTGQSTFEIQAYLKNQSQAVIEAAPWLVFQLRVPAVVNLQHLAGLPEAFKVFGEELPDGVLRSLGNTSFNLSLNLGGAQFKAGYNFSKENIRPTVTANFPDEKTSLSFEAENIKGPFPHGYCGETYACDRYFEQEFLPRIRLLRPNDTSDTLKVKCTLATIK